MEEDMENLLLVVANPTRRAIMEHLAREPHYALQLGRKLGVSQQAVMKHLDVLESAGIVGTRDEPSQEGPNRRYYFLKKRFSVRIDVRPDYCDSSVKVQEDDIEVGDTALARRFREVAATGDLNARAERLASLLDAIDGRMRRMADGYDSLVALKEEVRRELHDIVRRMSPDYGQRELLYCLVDSRASGVDEMSELLDLRKAAVQRMLDEMAEHRRFFRAMMADMERL